MASSNRHWPSMFKSKPCNNQPWPSSQPPHDTTHHQSSLLSNSCARSPSGCEERSPEPKPRWNPKPEQIRILEAIFNSGMVNPPRDEIRRIRGQLQEYGQVGDANVFYWFQNRKSRSKHKQRTLQSKIATQAPPPPPMPASSSSSSSDKASPRKASGGGGSASYGGGGTSSNNSSSNNNNNNNNNVVVDQFGNSPTSINQCNPYFHQIIPHHNNNNNNNTLPPNPNNTTYEFVPQEPLFFPLCNFSQGMCFGPITHHHDDGDDDDHHHHHQLMSSNVGSTVDVSGNSNQTVGGFSSLLVGDMFGGGGDQAKRDDEVEKLKFQQELSFLVANPSNCPTTTTTISSSHVVSSNASTGISTSLGQILGDSRGLAPKSTVFINGMTIEVPVGPFNIKEEFGEDAILINSGSGHPVLTNEWGVTLHPLQHGASYYLVSNVVATPLLDKLNSTPDLLAPGFPYQWNSSMNWT